MQHVVQFYEDENFLRERVIRFLAAGRSLGEPLLVIASEARRKAFLSGMERCGFNMSSGRLMMLDSQATLDELTVGSSPDVDRFKQKIADVIDELGGRTTNVRIFVDMFDLLWQRGDAGSALHLEEVSNELAGRLSFKLLCAYAMGATYQSSDRESLRHICTAHTHVLPLESSADEIPQRQEIEQALRESTDRLAALQEATARLAEAIRLEEVYDVVVSIVDATVGASAAMIYLRESGSLHLERAWKMPAKFERWKTIRLDAPLPLAAAIAQHRPIWIRNREALLEAFPGLDSLLPETQAIAALPLVRGDDIVGGISLHFSQPMSFLHPERRWLVNFATQSAQAMERARLYDELKETVRLNELFSAVLAHDLRNPLGAILTAAQVVSLRATDRRFAAPLARILACGGRMSRMIDQLLDLTRIRAGHGLQVERKRFDLSGLLQQVIDELEHQHPDWSLAMVSRGDPAGDWDDDRLFQLFSNLVANSIQHGLPEGGVKVTLDGGDPESVRVSVHNLGVISPEVMPTLFEPLTGADRSRKKRGLGLGLFITDQIAKAHGGSIDVESTETSGTTFTVTLPRNEQQVE